MPTTNKDIMDKLLEIEIKIEADKNTYRICHHCGGDGVKGKGDGYPCPDCGATGYIATGKIAKD